MYPYEYTDSLNKLDETKLPPIEKFYSQLKSENISKADYDHALNVWNIFNKKNLGEYSDMYLKTDVLLLADIFENFRDNCLKTYQLDALHYVTLPSFAYDAMLRLTKIELELLIDIDKILFLEKGCRGGLSQVSHRYAKANNKYMKKNYDPSKDQETIIYFDVVNLYGYIMSKRKLPYKNFEWIENLNEIELMNLNIDSDIGYIYEVDLEYPPYLHALHNELPLCPEHIAINKCNIKKLVANLYSKKNYVIHYINLQQCVSLGMKITKVHKILKFKQSNWLSSDIDLNNKLRAHQIVNFLKIFVNL